MNASRKLTRTNKTIIKFNKKPKILLNVTNATEEPQTFLMPKLSEYSDEISNVVTINNIKLPKFQKINIIVFN